MSLLAVITSAPDLGSNRQSNNAHIQTHAHTPILPSVTMANASVSVGIEKHKTHTRLTAETSITHNQQLVYRMQRR